MRIAIRHSYLTFLVCAAYACNVFPQSQKTATQNTSSDPSGRRIMTECEEDKKCSTWTFIEGHGTGVSRSGEIANLNLDKPELSSDKAGVDVTVRRVDSTGTSSGLIATYTGMWRNGQIEGEYTSSWPGHWKTKTGNWTARLEDPAGLPSAVSLRAGGNCYVFTLQNGQYFNYTNLPGESAMKRIISFRTFSSEAVEFLEIDSGSFPLKATLTGQITNEDPNVAKGFANVSQMAGKPYSGAPISFTLAWGSSIDSEGPDSMTQSGEPHQFTVDDAVKALKWLQVAKGIYDLANPQ